MSSGTFDYDGWEPVIGLEIHAQLLTQTKLFCGCETSFGDPPNTHTCPVCLGLPGALPMMNGEALRMAVAAGLAVGCTINQRSIFARKNYFYPDLPKGYQISQFEEPLATAGTLRIEADRGARAVGITRIHMEEDAGKNVHGVGGDSFVDLNRAGTPLIEIVGDPDLRSPAEARDYMKRLREILMFVGVNDGNLEQGSFRCDANVSVRRSGDAVLGTRVEMKNINSFRFVEDALNIEIRRQINLIERGGVIVQQTRGYNADKRESYLLREKEGDAGYRYFPEPDLPPLVVSDALVEQVGDTLAELPSARRARYTTELGLPPQAARVLTGHPEIAAFFDAAVATGADAIKVGNFVQSEVLRDVTTAGLAATFPVTTQQVGELVSLVSTGRISGKQSKQVYTAMRGTEHSPAAIVEQLGLEVIGDRETLLEHVREVIANNPKQADTYRNGKTGLLGYFVGQIMKATKGSADPKLVSELLREELAR